MNISIRKGTKDDMPSVHGFIYELAVYEKAPNEVTNTVEDMLVDGFGDQPIFFCLVAEVDDKIVGTAIYHLKYSTWKGRGVYLDDIVVTESMRGKKIGSKLFDAVMKDAQRLNAKQLHWQVLDWNEPAIQFYKKYNANMDGEWINCKLTQQQINNF
ncbi:MAG: GNAT family N-acetyltransferase [Bacteroidetes bacterium]|nr:GNAT family N-acetyltransferase [Bacteroidota bacterium]